MCSSERPADGLRSETSPNHKCYYRWQINKTPRHKAYNFCKSILNLIGCFSIGSGTRQSMHKRLLAIRSSHMLQVAHLTMNHTANPLRSIFNAKSAVWYYAAYVPYALWSPSFSFSPYFVRSTSRTRLLPGWRRKRTAPTPVSFLEPWTVDQRAFTPTNRIIAWFAPPVWLEFVGLPYCYFWGRGDGLL